MVREAIKLVVDIQVVLGAKRAVGGSKLRNMQLSVVDRAACSTANLEGRVPATYQDMACTRFVFCKLAPTSRCKTRCIYLLHLLLYVAFGPSAQRNTTLACAQVVLELTALCLDFATSWRVNTAVQTYVVIDSPVWCCRGYLYLFSAWREFSQQ